MLHSSLDDLAHLKSAIFLPLTPSPDKILLSLISKGQIFRLVSTKENNFDIFLPLPNSMTLVLKIWRINQPRDAHAPKTWPGRFRIFDFPLMVLSFAKGDANNINTQDSLLQTQEPIPIWQKISTLKSYKFKVMENWYSLQKKMIFWPKAVIRICYMMKKFKLWPQKILLPGNRQGQYLQFLCC